MEATRNQTGCMKTTIIMVGAAVMFIAAIILLADIKCSYDIENWWAPLYPNGETVSSRVRPVPSARPGYYQVDHGVAG